MTDPDAGLPSGEDVLVLSRWHHDDVQIVRLRLGNGAELDTVAGDDAVLAVVAAWLRGGARRPRG